MKLLNLFSKPLPSVETWATHNAKKATPDDLIAGAIVRSFAKDFKHWKFEGGFHQKHSPSGSFCPTSLNRKVSGKKHIEVIFVFRMTKHSDGYSSIYKYVPIGCEVNGVRVTDAAFQYIYKNWNNIVVTTQHAETVALKAKNAMEVNEKKWNLAEALLDMKRDGLGRLMPVKTVAESGEA